MTSQKQISSSHQTDSVSFEVNECGQINSPEPLVSSGATVVAKVGSSTLMGPDDELDSSFIRSLCEQICALRSRGLRVILVSSGAAATGRARLGFDARPSDIPTLQACASAGQAALTEVYAEVLAERGVPCGQVLLTRADVTDRTGYLNARNTLERLLELGAVPVVNENDTVSVREFTFGDNDMLGAIVATLIDADLYVILSDVAGLYTANPQENPSARLITRVEHVDGRIISMAGGTESSYGMGGMATKVRAGRAMLAAGIPMVVCEGRMPEALQRAVDGTVPGTLFAPAEGASIHHEQARKLWIGLAGVSRGALIADDGACRALINRGASLLPVGVIDVHGDFNAGDIVSIYSRAGDLVARGICRFSSDEMRKIRGLRLDIISRFLSDRADSPAVHRDEMLVF